MTAGQGLAYRRPERLDEALGLLDEHGFDAKVLAGGQSLVAMMNTGLVAPEVLVDINRLPGLDRVEVGGDGVRIGALVRHRALERPDEALRRAAPLLPAAARFISHGAVRNRGTMVGSLVHADPSAEWPAVALALDARIRLVHLGGERWVGAPEFFVGPLSADIEPTELAVEVRLPAAPPRTGAAVEELAYRHGDYAVAGVAAQVSLDQAGAVTDVRAALFGVDATPVRAVAAEAAIREGGMACLDDAAELAASAANPVSDAVASADYRRDMIPVLFRRALRAAHAAAAEQAG